MTTTPSYQQTIPGIMNVLQLFHQAKLSYILFKCEHIFAGENKNADILFETDDDYGQAARLLEQQGWALRFSERFEKYKLMYCGFADIGKEKTFHFIHLHREIAWHGIKALDKKWVFERKKIVTPLIVVPSLEDSILIHAAHVLFENFKVTEKERPFLNQFLDQNRSKNGDPKRDKKDLKPMDRKYLQQQLTHHKWKGGFVSVLKYKDSPTLPPGSITATWIKKLVQEPATAAYVGMKIAQKIFRPLQWKRRGCLIAFIGVNGSGKSTLARKTLEQYQPLTRHLGKKQQSYYFGWQPEFPLTKLLSRILQKNDKKLFQEINFVTKSKKFDLFQELLFIYLFFEFYYRYVCHLRPQLRQGNLIITDRYFYDLYGQYPYAGNSFLIKPLLHLFPKPDFTYLLDLEVEKLRKRGKINREAGKEITAIERKIYPYDYLQQQRENYLFLQRYLSTRYLHTAMDIQQCTTTIILESWRKLL